MVDTIRIFLSQESTPNVDLLSEIPPRFTDYSVHESSGNIWYTGYLKNLKWGVFKSGLSIAGSLPKFHFGENYTVLKSDHIKMIFDQLNTVFDVDLKTAKITQIDFGVNLLCTHKVSDYFKYLGRSPYYNSKHINNTTLTYSNSIRSKQFYDKLREMKDSTGYIPDHLIGKNLLRFEIKYRKKLSNYFDTDVVTVGDLFNRSFLTKLKLQIRKEFESIKRVKSPAWYLNSLDTPSSLRDQLAALSIGQYGLDKITEVIEESNEMNARSKARARKMCYDLTKDFSPNETDLYDELHDIFNETLSTLD